MKIHIPYNINKIISLLKESGHSAYIVGGCVRDALLGREAYDFDVTTSASPPEIKEALYSYKTIDTGIAHGTVTAVTENGNIEITTYRIDGKYTDNRRPDKVQFTNSLEEDLSRRDFTINALAYNDEDGLIDLFGGVDDLKNGIIRAIGNARERFNEDALRILRAVRFCAQIGFVVESSTSRAMIEMRGLINNLSRERVKAEIEKALISPHAEDSLKNFGNIIATALRVSESAINYKGISGAFPKSDLRFAFLLYNCPDVYEIMNGLKCENSLKKSVALLCENLYFSPQNEYELKKYISRHSIEHAEKLSALKAAAKISGAEDFKNLLSGIDFSKECLSVNELDISGHDLIHLGYRDNAIGKTLEALLDMVIKNEVKNERDALILKALSIFTARG